MKSHIRCIALPLLLLLSTLNFKPSTSAQGTAFTYQGRLNAAGEPVSGIYDLRFAIYDSAEAGAAVAGPLTNSAVAVTNGLFTTTLDFGAGVFNGAERWLDISVRAYEGSAFTILSPRQPLTSTPYAIRAANFSGPVAASQLTGTISTNNIGAGTITSTKLADGAVTANKLAAGSVTTAALADGAVNLAKLNTAVVGQRLTTFVNPTPAADDLFGSSVAAVGSDKVIIGARLDDTGANAAGAAYLFNLSGLLLATFTNPTPDIAEYFGWSVASAGSDKVFIGAPGYSDNNTGEAVGAAYLFSINGTLLTTFTNPAPTQADSFGYSVAGAADKVLIGAYGEDTGATNAGAAYLFSTNGTLLTSITNPAPAVGDQFGIAVAFVGLDKLLVGAHWDDTGATDAGAAYLFSTNGALLTVFTNPTPAVLDQFGESVAAVGSDSVLIGAPFDKTGANGAGAAYLFSANGTLIRTFTNPFPGFVDFFGISVAGMGPDKVVIGACGDDTGAPGSGGAYLFSTNGTLIATFANPAPDIGDNLGISVAAVGSDKVVVGAHQDDLGATNSGVAYLFGVTKPHVVGLISAGVVDGAITSASIAAGAVTADKVATVSNSFVVTIGNPTPAALENFGAAVAGVGTDRLLVGAYLDNAGAVASGAAYLFDVNGALLTTFTNPTPAPGENFGVSVAALGTDRVLIGARFGDGGAPNAGAAYLFSVGGALLTTFTNPTPASADHFGEKVAALGTDRVLIGAYQDDTGAPDSGAAYLFHTNGTLLTTFTNPTPALFDHFGVSVAAMGTDGVLIGAWKDDRGAIDVGAAYLFSANGALLTTFTNPAPASNEYFGISVAALGNRVLIGAFGDANNTGAAYLFSANGTLLATFTNPTPADGDLFGYSVAAVGTDRVLIGAYGDDTGALDAGAAYLFNTNGTLLETYTNSTPTVGGNFGYSIAALGTDGVLIGTFGGPVYLFGTETYTPGLIADGVNADSITAASIQDGAVTIEKLESTIGVWTRAGDNVYRPAGNVGIGTANPQAPLHIRASGQEIRLQGQVTGNANSAYIGFADGAGTDLGWVGDGSSSDNSMYLTSYSGNVHLYTAFGAALTATPAGNIGIRRSPAANALEVEGNASKTTAGSWVANSDARIKTDIATITNALETLNRVRLVSFRYNDAYRAAHPAVADKPYLNVVAQEFRAVFPAEVQSSREKLPDGSDEILQVDTHPLTIYSAAAIQELNQKFAEELKRRDAENAGLKRSVEELRALVNALVRKLNGDEQ